MPGSTELPIFEWYDNRREFLRGSVRLVAGGLIYEAAAPLLAACSTADGTPQVSASETQMQGEIPERHFSPELVRWKVEQEGGQRDYLLGQIATLESGTLVVKDVNGDIVGRVETGMEASDDYHELAFSPDGHKIFIATMHGNPRLRSSVTTVELPEFHLWSPLGSTLPEQIPVTVAWSPDSRQIAMRVFELGRVRYLRVSHFTGGNVIFGEPVNFVEKPINLPSGSGLSKFSPDSKILAHDDGGRVTLWDLEADRSWQISEGYVVDWLPDGKALLIFGNRSQELSVYNLETQRMRKIASLVQHSSFPSNFPVRVSADGQFVYVIRNLARNYHELDRIPIDSTDEGQDAVPLHRFSVDLMSGDLGWMSDFILNSRGEVLVSDYRGSHKPIKVFRIEEKTSDVKQEYSLEHPQNESLYPIGFAPSDLFLYESSVDNVSEAQLYALSLKSGQKTKVARRAWHDSNVEYGYSMYSLGDGDVIRESGRTQFIHSGRRYEISSGTSVGVENIVRLPEQFATKIPESENRMDFRAGEILVGPGGRGWYLQNGGRYEIPGRLEDFVQRRHKNMRAYEVPAWVLDKISAKEMPFRFFEDQHGRMIDGTSPRLFLLSQGMGSESTKDLQVFSGMIAFLKSIGYRDEQILFGTCNVEVKRFGNSREITPLLHTREHSTGSVNDSLITMSYNLDWLGEKAPTAQLTLIGHSQAGFVGLRGALSHPQMVCQVVTIDSPHKGVDDVVLNFNGIDFDRIGFYFGQAGEDFVRLGESASFGEEVEGLARKVTNYGIDLFTFSNARDRIVNPERAILRNATRRIGSYEVPLLWNGPEGDGILPAHGWLLDHPQFLEVLVGLVGRP